MGAHVTGGAGGGTNNWDLPSVGLGYYSTGGTYAIPNYTNVPLITTTPHLITSPPFAPTIEPIGKGVAKLTPAQVDMLMREHHFVPMDVGPFCLFCFALDVYRDERAHDFVIHEE